MFTSILSFYKSHGNFIGLLSLYYVRSVPGDVDENRDHVAYKCARVENKSALNSCYYYNKENNVRKSSISLLCVDIVERVRAQIV